MNTRFHGALLALTLLTAPAALMRAEAQVTVGGSPMHANKDVVDNAVNSKDHTTLVAAVKAAGLVDTVLKPENAKETGAAIKAGKGTARMKIVQGEMLAFSVTGSVATVSDSKSTMSHVTIPDVRQSNGVIHVVDKVLLPG